MNRSVGLVIPAYHPDISTLEAYVKNIQNIVEPTTILIELDSPRTETHNELTDQGFQVNTVPYRRGKGAAITAGFEALDTDILAFADADGATAPASLANVIDPVQNGDIDLSVGSRRHPEADIRSHQTYARRILGDWFAWFARRMLDAKLYDYQCGAKAILASAWSDVRKHLFESGFAWDIDLIAAAGALDLQIKEVPITWEDKPGSTVSPVRTSIDLANALFAARHRAKRIKGSHLHQMIGSIENEPTSLVDQKHQ